MARTIQIPVREVCGESPYHFAKNEAVKLLHLLSNTDVASHDVAEVQLDFDEVVGISSSGAQLLLTGLVHFYGQNVLKRFLFQSVEKHLMQVIEDAAANLHDGVGIVQ